VANAIEGRDDIQLKPAGDDMIRAFVFETANPQLSGPITTDSAERWITAVDRAR
jgi:hypothetical protein